MTIAVEELKRLSGFDTVIGVRNLSDGSLHAVAEARDDQFPSYLDKRFPKSDIPEPGRRQMLRTPLQYVPDLAYEPVPLKTLPVLGDPGQIDLGDAVLRSLSRMCNRFYLNMGIRGRLILSLIQQGQLWGFFNLWNATPRTVAYRDRLAYQSFAALAAALLIEKESAEQDRKALQVNRAVGTIASALASTASLAEELRALPAQLKESLDAAGTALCLEDQVVCAGATPDEAELQALRSWLDQQDRCFATDRLADLFEPAGLYSERATGLLAIRLMGPGILSARLPTRVGA